MEGVRSEKTIGAERSASDGGKLFAGVDVLEHRFVEAREMLVPFLEHRLDPIGLQLEPHFLLRWEEEREARVFLEFGG